MIFENDLLQLIQYYPSGPRVFEVPLLIVPPWINRYYILDLTPATSMVRWLVQQGHTVFVISWVNPDASMRGVGFSDYLERGCLPALDQVRDISGAQRVDLMGYCIGGVLAACLAAWLAAGDGGDEARLNTLTLLNTMLDYSDPGDLGLYLTPGMLAAVENEVSARGYLGGRIMSVAFSLLRADRNYWPQFVRSYLEGRPAKRDPMSHWNFDATNLPAAMIMDYLNDFYRDNSLAEPGGLEMCGRRLDLGRVSVPCTMVACERDHLVPWRAAYTGAGMLGGPTNFLLSGGGHVTGIVSPPGGGEKADGSPARHQVSWREAVLGEMPDEWLQDTPRQAGSWWARWHELLLRHHTDKVNARFPGDAPIEPAPGSYVHRLHPTDESEGRS